MIHIDGLEKINSEIDKENDIYVISIDGKIYNIPISIMLDFMNKSDEDFKNICLNSQIIAGIPKEHFAFACTNYLSEKNNHDSRFDHPIIRRHYNILLNYELIDFESINKDLDIIDKVYDKVELKKEVKDLITSRIPQDYNTLEKAIYIYIKMCELFTYDREYFSQNQSYQKDLDYISTISSSNLEIVCFEFVVIYAQLLSEIGVNFRSYYGNKQKIYELRSIMDSGELSYGQKHAFTEFRVGKFLVDADAMESILEGDLVNVKIHKPLNGIQCLNSNQETQREFDEIVKKVYENFKLENKTHYTLNNSYLNHLEDLNINERLTIFLKQINLINLTGLDAYGTILELKRILFTKDEQKNNFIMSIIKNNEPDDKQTDIVAIISINPDNFDYYPERTQYYILYPNMKSIETNIHYLENAFNNRVFEYINDKTPTIPNITTITFEEDNYNLSQKKKKRRARF